MQPSKHHAGKNQNKIGRLYPLIMASNNTHSHGRRKVGDDFQVGGVLAISACHFIHDVYSSFLAPLLPLLIEKFSMSLTRAGLLTTVMQIPALLNPYLGSLADRAPVRYFIIFAPMGTAIPMCLLGLAPSYGVLIILLFITGVSVAVFHVPAPTMIARLSGGRKGKGMSFYMTGGELARTLGPLIAVGGVSVLGLEGFYPIMVVGVMASAWLLFRFRDTPVDMSRRPARQPIGRTWRRMRYVLGPLIGILVARGFMHACMTAYLPTFITQETGDLWLAGLSLMLFEGSGVAGVLTAGPLSDRLGRRRVLLVSLIGAPLGLLLFGYTDGWARIVALLLTGFTLLSTSPVMMALVQEHARDAPSAANGLFMMSSFMARSAIVVVVGAIGDRIGLGNTFFISAALGALGIPFILMLPKGNGAKS